jgi:CPA2 family monovalent cation:H+ antiporter-2
MLDKIRTFRGQGYDSVSTAVGPIAAGLLGLPSPRSNVGLMSWALSRAEAERQCRHLSLLDAFRGATTGTYACERCLAVGDTWRGLRLCRSCGHTGCCEKSARRHADRHFRETGHPIVDAVGPQRAWSFCYIDRIRVFA